MPHYASYRGVALAILVLLSTLATIWRMSRSDRRDAKMAFLLSLMGSSDPHLDRDSSR